MANSPSTDNYVLGKGVVYFNELVSGTYQGERDLGNAPAFSFNVAVEKLEHYSSRGGLKAKDKEVISQITPGIAFTLDEINASNVGLLSLGETVDITDAAAVGDSEVINTIWGMRTALANRNIGTSNLWKLTLTTGGAELPVVGETLTGGTSTGTFMVVYVPTSTTATSGDFWVYPLTSTTPTAGGEAYTGDIACDGTTSAAVDHGSPLLLTDDDDATVVYDPWNTTTETGDYWFNTSLKDDKAGRILVMEDGSLPNDGADETPTDVYVSYYSIGGTYKRVKSFTKNTIEGFLRFISDNPVGTQQELKIWSVSLSPTGDTAFIGEDWSTLGFTGEVLKDETGHPDSPYMDINFL